MEIFIGSYRYLERAGNIYWKLEVHIYTGLEIKYLQKDRKYLVGARNIYQGLKIFTENQKYLQSN